MLNDILSLNMPLYGNFSAALALRLFVWFWPLMIYDNIYIEQLIGTPVEHYIISVPDFAVIWWTKSVVVHPVILKQGDKERPCQQELVSKLKWLLHNTTDEKLWTVPTLLYVYRPIDARVFFHVFFKLFVQSFSFCFILI